MKNKRNIVIAGIVLFIVTIVLFFVRNNKVSEVEAAENTSGKVSMDNIGNANLNEDIIVFTEKESENIIKSVKSVDFNNKERTITFLKKVPKPIKNLNKGDKFFIAPSIDNQELNILANGFVGQVEIIEEDYIVVKSPGIQEVFTELYIDTSLIKNQIGVKEMYLADGVSVVENTDKHLADNNTTVRYDVQNIKNDGSPVIENISLAIEGFKVDDVSLSGDVHITDLGVDYKLDYNMLRPSKIEDAKLKVSGNIGYSLSLGMKKELVEAEKELNLGFVYFDLGTMTVQVGTGNKFLSTVGVGVFIKVNMDGTVSLEAEVILNYDDYFEKGIELVKVDGKNNIEILKEEEEEPIKEIIIQGEIEGDAEVYNEFELSILFLGIDITSMSIDTGADFSGAIKLGLAATLDDIDLGTAAEAELDWFSRFRAEVDILDVIGLNVMYVHEFYRDNIFTSSKKLKFDGKTFDLSGLEEIFSVEEDMNGDNIKDRVVIYGRPITEEITSGEEKKNKYIVIIDGKNQKVLTSIDCAVVYPKTLITTKINTIVDLNDDGIKEIVVDSHSGGTAGGESYLLEYKNGTYVAATFEDVKIEHRLTDGFKVEFVEKNSGKTYTTNLTEDQRKRYVEAKAYKKDGKFVTDYKHYVGNGNVLMHSQVFDIDNDGKLEYVKQKFIVGVYNADSVSNLIEIYEYRDGKYVLKDYLAQAGEHEYNKDFKEPEAFKIQENTSSTPEEVKLFTINNLGSLRDYFKEYSDQKTLHHIYEPIHNTFKKEFPNVFNCYIDEASISVKDNNISFTVTDSNKKPLKTFTLSLTIE